MKYENTGALNTALLFALLAHATVNRYVAFGSCVASAYYCFVHAFRNSSWKS